MAKSKMRVHATRLSDEQHRVICEAAQATGMSFSAFLRRSGLSCARRQLVAPGVVVRGAARLRLNEQEEVADARV